MIIEARNLTKSYGSRRGVIDVCLEIARGEIFGFLGPNGAGKSTTIRVLTGFLKATSGSATILRKDCWRDSAAIKRDVGYVPGDVRLYPWLTARKAFQIVGEIRDEDITKRGMELAERFRLEPDLPVRKMSRGNRQKVALVTALAHNPRLVILDEPTSGLDPLMQETLADCLRELATAGNTVFFSSHTLSEVESLCDRVAIVRDGRIAIDERIQSLKQRAPRTVVLTFDTKESAERFEPPAETTLKRRYKREVVITIEDSAIEFSRWATRQPAVIDISVSPPSLDALFRSYYEPEAG